LSETMYQQLCDSSNERFVAWHKRRDSHLHEACDSGPRARPIQLLASRLLAWPFFRQLRPFAASLTLELSTFIGGEMGSTEATKFRSHAGVPWPRKTTALRILSADNNGYALAA
jgi:hypothetical protein